MPCRVEPLHRGGNPARLLAVELIQTIDGGEAGGILVLALPDEGEPLPGSPALLALDAGLEAGAQGVVVDTSARDIVTSAAIGFVIRVRQHLAPGVPMALLGGRQLDRLVAMMNLTGVLPTFATIDAAKAHVVGS